MLAIAPSNLCLSFLCALAPLREFYGAIYNLTQSRQDAKGSGEGVFGNIFHPCLSVFIHHNFKRGFDHDRAHESRMDRN